MKELSIEQKAKAYDEAINRMKHYVVDEYGCSRIKVVDVFPELKESEDERIKNFISNELMCLRAVECNSGGKDSDRYKELTSAIAWLEKQGEPLNESVYDTEDKEIYQAISIGLTDVFNEFGWSDFGGIPIENIQNWLEKQGEQILANSAKTCKDEQKPHWNVGDTLAYYGFYSDREGECVFGKVTNVEFDEEQCDWFYTFEDGSVYDEQSLLEDQTYKKN